MSVKANSYTGAAIIIVWLLLLPTLFVDELRGNAGVGMLLFIILLTYPVYVIISASVRAFFGKEDPGGGQDNNQEISNDVVENTDAVEVESLSLCEFFSFLFLSVGVLVSLAALIYQSVRWLKTAVWHDVSLLDGFGWIFDRDFGSATEVVKTGWLGLDGMVVWVLDLPFWVVIIVVSYVMHFILKFSCNIDDYY